MPLSVSGMSERLIKMLSFRLSVREFNSIGHGVNKKIVNFAR